MKTTFKLVSSELADDELQDLTQKICRDIEEETGVEVARPKGVALPGARGGPDYHRSFCCWGID